MEVRWVSPLLFLSVTLCHFVGTHYASSMRQRHSAPFGFAEAACSNTVQREASAAVAERDNTCRDAASQTTTRVKLVAALCSGIA